MRKPFWKRDENGKIIWKDMFKMGYMEWAFLIMVLVLAFAYQNDMEECLEIVEDPVSYCIPYCEARNPYAVGDFGYLFNNTSPNTS